MKKTIFISYGHDEENPKHIETINKIKSHLVKEGFTVLMDIERLKTGDDWQLKLEEDISKSDWVLFFITPYSARRPDGYCLNELSFALYKKKLIAPVMIDFIEPPLSICRVQYLDLQKEFKKQDFNSNKFKKKINELIHVLNGDNALSFEGSHVKIESSLTPIDFSSEISNYLKNFIGRQWVYDEVDIWLTEEKSQILWITADAGFGKSAIAAFLANKHPGAIGIHFCNYLSGITKDPIAVLKTFAYQLSTQLPEYRKKLELLNIENIFKLTNIHDVFKYLFVDTLNNIKCTKEYFFIIDALDEASIEEGNSILEMIINDFNKLPAWLNLLVLSRPEPLINIRFSKLKPLQLDGESLKNKNDLYVYLSSSLQDKNLSEKQIKIILNKSEGNILYLKEVVNELRLKRLSIDDIESFPQGLTSVYEGYFNRNFSVVKDYEKFQLPLIELLVASRKPFEITLLLEILNINLRTYKKIIEPMGSLIVEDNNKIRFFHKSLSDWITEKASYKYFADKREGYIKIINYMESNNNISTIYLLDYLFYTYIDTFNYVKAVNILNNLDTSLLDKFGSYTTIIYYRELLDNTLKKRDPVNLGYLAKYEYFFGNFKKSILLYKQAIKLTLQDDYLIEYYMNMGKANRNLGKTKEAKKFYVKALDISLKNNNYERINEQYGNLGNLYRATCQYKRSIHFYNKAIKNSLEYQHTKNLTTHYSNMAIATYDIGKFQESKNFFKIALGQEMDERRKIITISNFVHTLLDLGKYKLAYKYSKEACIIEEKIKSDINLIYCNLAQGRYFLLCKNYNKAEKIFLSTLDICNRLEATREQNRTYTWLATLLYLKNDYKGALQYAKYALQYYSEQDNHYTMCIYALIELNLYNRDKYAKKTILESERIIEKSSNYYRAYYSMALSYFAIYTKKKKFKFLDMGLEYFKVAYNMTNQSKHTLAFYLKLLPKDEKIMNLILKEI